MALSVKCLLKKFLPEHLARGLHGCDSGSDDERVESIDIPLRGLTIVRPVHASVLSKQHCFQITTPLETKYFTCASADDANSWIAGLKEIIYPNRDKVQRINTSLEFWIFEAKGLPSKKRYYCEIVLDKVLYGRTSTKLKSDILFWGEQFVFDDIPQIDSVYIYIFRETDSKKKRKEKSVFVGSIEIPLETVEANTDLEKWFPLHLPGLSPKPQPKSQSNNKADQTSIRVKMKYQTVSILPMSSYKELLEFVKTSYLPLCKELESVISLKSKDELAQTLLKILQVSNQAKEFLADIIMAEVDSLENDNLTFRGNTLATKSMDTYMKMVGKKYLQETLGQFVTSLYGTEEDCEVDPTKLSPNSNLNDNQKALTKLVEEAWGCILGSYCIFPSDLQETFNLIRKRCEKQGRDVSMKLISGSVFLRFLCPAILSPSLFDLTQEYPDEKTARCLTLVTKTLQNLANFTRFGGKEMYMECLNEFVERELPNMKNFLDLISSYGDYGPRGNCDTFPDLGKELALLTAMLTEHVEKLKEDDLSKLSPLKDILDSLKEKKMASSRNGTSGTLEKPRVFRTSSLPKDAEQRLSTLKMSPRIANLKNTIFADCTISSAEDYVSGCSLLPHTPYKPRGSFLQRTKGRAQENRLSTPGNSGSSTPRTSKKTPPKVPEKPPKSDIQRLLQAISKEHSQQGNGFVRSSSYHGRTSREEKPSLVASSSVSFDTGKGSSNRLSVPHSGVDNRYRSQSDNSSQGSSPRSSLEQLRHSDDRSSNHSRSASGGSVKGMGVSLDSIDTTPVSRYPIDGSKTIRRLPDIIHETGPHDGYRPSYYSPSTQTVTNLSHRDDYGTLNGSHRLRATAGSNEQLSRSADSVRLREMFLRSAQISNHSNNSNESLNRSGDSQQLRAMFQNVRHNYAGSTKSKSSDESLGQSETTTKPRVMNPRVLHQYYNWTVKQSDSDLLDQTSGALQLRRVSSGYYQRSHTIDKRNSISADATRSNLNISDTVKRKVERSGSLPVSTKIYVNSNRSDRQEPSSDPRPHTDSFRSSCSSGYSDPDRGSLCSSESYSYSSADETDATVANNTRVDVQTVMEGCDVSESYTTAQGSTLKMEYAKDENSNTLPGEEPKEKIANHNTPSEELENEILRLRNQLQECQSQLTRQQHDFDRRSRNYEQTIDTLKLRLSEAESKLKRQKKERDDQMKNIIGRLMNVESELRKEQNDTQEIVEAKQRIIDVQEKRIKSLDAANKRLLAALSQLRTKCYGINGTTQEQNSDGGSSASGKRDDDPDVQQV